MGLSKEGKWIRANLDRREFRRPQLLGQLGITQMLHVDPYRLDPTVARARFRVLIDYCAHHGSGRLLQAMDLEPETFPTEHASGLIHVHPTYVGHSRAAPRHRWSLPGEEVGEEVHDRSVDLLPHLCLHRRVYDRPPSDFAALMARPRRMEVIRLRLLRAIRDLGV